MSDDPIRPLFDAATAGDSHALDVLVARYLPRLHAYVRLHMSAPLRSREASVDVVQSVCREVLEARDGFEFRGESALLGWLLTTALNKLRERARFHGRQRRDLRREAPAADVDTRVYASLVTPSRDAIAQEEIERLEAALDRMPDDYREVILLARIVGLPHREIATRLGRTESATRTLLGRALTRLAAGLDER
ncbi:MAG: sigma-70 family RNA polymerase sigma factor [Planctomycetes bacterium]|nr:sigma-70 family RNA polymerase sigma factor [Planctomycetota bacterium]